MKHIIVVQKKSVTLNRPKLFKCQRRVGWLGVKSGCLWIQCGSALHNTAIVIFKAFISLKIFTLVHLCLSIKDNLSILSSGIVFHAAQTFQLLEIHHMCNDCILIVKRRIIINFICDADDVCVMCFVVYYEEARCKTMNMAYSCSWYRLWIVKGETLVSLYAHISILWLWGAIFGSTFVAAFTKYIGTWHRHRHNWLHEHLSLFA